VTFIGLREKAVVAYFKQLPFPGFMVHSGSRIVMLEPNLLDGDDDNS
jgi:hypothetical protein